MSVAEPTTDRTAETSVPILEVLAERWSPRSYDATAEVTEHALTAMLEAARWTPSANNVQPWRFIVGRRGTPVFDTIASNLKGFNQGWAPNASALIVNVAEVTDASGKPQSFALYDLGQAVAHLSVQAHHEGYHVHQMGGFEVEGIRAAFDLAPHLLPVSVTAIGVVANADLLEEPARSRELAPRVRKPLDEVVAVRA